VGRRRLWQLVVLELGDREAGGADRIERRAVAVAAVADDPAHAVQPVLPAGYTWLVGANVLDEEELAFKRAYMRLREE
jgi:hypothetical protein